MGVVFSKQDGLPNADILKASYKQNCICCTEGGDIHGVNLNGYLEGLFLKQNACVMIVLLKLIFC